MKWLFDSDVDAVLQDGKAKPGAKVATVDELRAAIADLPGTAEVHIGGVGYGVLVGAILDHSGNLVLIRDPS